MGGVVANGVPNKKKTFGMEFENKKNPKKKYFST